MDRILTEQQEKALQILRDNGYLTARSFAEKMWSESPGWSRVKNTGNGATCGKGMWLAAGSYLTKLVIMDFVCIDFKTRTGTKVYGISSKGRKKLEEQKDQNFMR